jgi:hypothetical protein
MAVRRRNLGSLFVRCRVCLSRHLSTNLTAAWLYALTPPQLRLSLKLRSIRKSQLGASIDASTSREIHEAIFKFRPFQRRVIAHHAQEALTHLREQTLANSLEQLIGTAINLNHAEFREFAHPNMDKLT